MSELLASYWRTPIVSTRSTKTAYLDLFDNGISANVVLFVDKFKMQIPKWVIRDFLSLAVVMYPKAVINRRENPERVLVEDVMIKRLAVAGFRYNPGHAHTYLPYAGTDPNSTLEPITGDPVRTAPEHMSRADLAREGDHREMFQMIKSDIKQAEQEGADMKKWVGIDSVCAAHGWTRFEVAIMLHVLKLYADSKAKQ